MLSLAKLSKICYYALVLNIIAIMCFSYKAETVAISYCTYAFSTLVMILHIIYRKNKIILDKYYVALIAFLVWCIASNLWSVSIETSYVSTLTILQLTIYGLILYEFLRFSDINQKKLLIALGIGTIVMGTYSIIYYGPSEFFEAIVSGKRLGFEINQENTFSTFACIGSIAWFGLFFLEYKVKYLSFAILSILFIIAGGSRGSLLSFVPCVLLMLFNQRNIKRKYLYTFLVTFLFCMMIYFIGIYGTDIDVIRRMVFFFNVFTSSGYTDTAALMRIDLIKYGLEKFTENPILGYGLNCYREIVLQYLGFMMYAHNNFIEILCDLGLIGFSIYYYLYFLVWQKRKMINHSLFVLVIFTLIVSMFDPNYYSKILYIIFSMALGTTRNTNEVKNVEKT